MRGILADINVEGILPHLGRIRRSDTWREIWFGLGIAIESFESLGLPANSSDAVIWRTCQREQLVLITENRNADAPDSLEMVIRAENQPDRLPVMTLARPQRITRDRLYAENVAEKLLDYLMRIDEIRGTGRIYVP
jgi:hypothetical protein